MKFFGFIPHSYPQKTTFHTTPGTMPFRVRSEVVFGTPSKNCSGNGICMLTQHRSACPLVCVCPKALAWFSIDLVARQIILEFDLQEMSEEIQRKYFSQSCFLIEESVKVPQVLAKKWEISGRVYLKEGLHTVIRNKKTVSVIFNI